MIKTSWLAGALRVFWQVPSAFMVGVVLLVAASGPLAHGDWKPQHGGILNDGETTFEFVFRQGDVDIYISDHGEPLSTRDAEGRLEVTVGDKVQVYGLEPAGDNKLQGKVDRIPQTGDRLLARVVMGDSSIRVGRIRISLPSAALGAASS